MSDESEWARWARDFRSEAGAAEGPSTEALLARARRETRAQRRAYVAEAAASALVVGFYAVTLGRLRAPWFVALAAANFAFVAVWMTHLTRVRRGTWAAAGSDARTFLALARARRAADLRWLRFGRACGVAMLLFVAAWAPFVLRARWQLYAAEPWRAVVGFGGVALIVLAVLAWQTRRIARVAAELRALDEAAGD